MCPAGGSSSLTNWESLWTSLKLVQSLRIDLYWNLAQAKTPVLSIGTDHSTSTAATIWLFWTTLKKSWAPMWHRFNAPVIITTLLMYHPSTTAMTSSFNHNEKSLWRPSSFALLFHGLSNPDDKVSKSISTTERKDIAQDIWDELGWRWRQHLPLSARYCESCGTMKTSPSRSAWPWHYLWTCL